MVFYYGNGDLSKTELFVFFCGSFVCQTHLCCSGWSLHILFALTKCQLFIHPILNVHWHFQLWEAASSTNLVVIPTEIFRALGIWADRTKAACCTCWKQVSLFYAFVHSEMSLGLWEREEKEGLSWGRLTLWSSCHPIRVSKAAAEHPKGASEGCQQSS